MFIKYQSHFRYKKKKSLVGLSLFSKKFMFFLVWFWWRQQDSNL